LADARAISKEQDYARATVQALAPRARSAAPRLLAARESAYASDL